MIYVRTRPTPDYLPNGFWYVRLFGDNRDRLHDKRDNDNDGLIDEADEGNYFPNLLCSISNGTGRSISLLYESHIKDMLRDEEMGKQWNTVIPFTVSVLRRLDVFDGQNSTNVREMKYHDGYYDGKEKEFRGFERAEQREVGDGNTNIPDLIMAYTFDTGASEEALKGKPRVLEAETAAGEVFYREKYTWDTKKLADGTNGDERKVTFPFQKEKRRDIREKGSNTPVQLKWEYEYDDYGNMTRHTEHGRLDAGWDDERVTETTYTSDYPSGLSHWILDKVVTSTTKDEKGEKAAEIRNYYDGNLALGEVTKGNLTKVEDWVSGSKYVTSVRNDYDTYGNIIAIYDPLYGTEPGHYRQLLYDPAYHTFPVEEMIYTGSLTLAMTATYDPGFGVMKTSTDYNGFTTTYDYDTFGRLTSITNPPDTDHTVEYDYELAHKLKDGNIINWVETRQRDGNPGDGFLKSRTFYDGLGRKIMTRAEGEDTSQVVVTDTVKFNARKLPWKKYLPYFETGTLDFVDPAYNTGFTEHIYDALGREIRMNQPIGPDGVLYSTTIYKPLEKTIHDEEQTRSDSVHAGNGMRYVTDGLLDEDGNGRLREVYEIVKLSDTGEPLGSPAEWKTTYSYDLLDNLTGYTDSQNNQKIMEYDGLSRKTFMNDPDRGYMTYTYDDASNLRETVDARGQIIKYRYDGVNRLTAEFYGTGKSVADVEYHYDEPGVSVGLGDLWEGIQPKMIAEAILTGKGHDSGLDLNGDSTLDVSDIVKAKRMFPQDNTVNAENTKGFLSWVRDQSGEEHNSYDKRGRVRWVVKRIKGDGQNGLNNYYSGMEYDSMDRVTSLTYPDGAYGNYKYNDRGLLESVPGVIDSYDYNPAGQNKVLELACGTKTTYDYDQRLRLSGLKTTRNSDGLTLQDLKYTYDGVSNITNITDGRGNETLDTIGTELGIGPAEARKFNATQSFIYDSLYRLTQAKNTDIYGTINYRYDHIGNMVRKNVVLTDPEPLMDLGVMTSGGTAGTSGRIGRNQGDPPGPHAITNTEKGPNGAMVFTYDDNGNMRTDRGMTLNWDFKDRLTGLTNDTKRAQYLYDYTDTRKKKSVNESVNGTTIEAFYIDKFSEVRDGKLMKYVYAGGSRVARADGSQNNSSALLPVTFYLHDHLGSSNITLTSKATVTEQMVNYPFGHQRYGVKVNPTTNMSDYKFTGKETDVESGLQYFEARYLSGHFGRFISVDPLGENSKVSWLENPQNLNFYSYTNNNPIVLVDPDGRAALSVFFQWSVSKIPNESDRWTREKWIMREVIQLNELESNTKDYLAHLEAKYKDTGKGLLVPSNNEYGVTLISFNQARKEPHSLLAAIRRRHEKLKKDDFNTKIDRIADILNPIDLAMTQYEGKFSWVFTIAPLLKGDTSDWRKEWKLLKDGKLLNTRTQETFENQQQVKDYIRLQKEFDVHDIKHPGATK
ncbi:MAG: hypothetical protein MRK01_05195 [Candidatus Scalindua sp.]|nr:hypothetical protein [Candidatus Scalindua sp.]